MASGRITVRLGARVLKAVRQKAESAGKTDALWVRELIERAVGVTVPLKRGFGSMSAAKRRQMARKGGEAKHRKSMENG